MDDLPLQRRNARKVLALRLALLSVWASVSFVACFFARELEFVVFGWPFGYWFAAQGAMLTFIAIVAFHAFAMRRLAPEDSIPTGTRDELG